jgi:hypothetical protein
MLIAFEAFRSFYKLANCIYTQFRPIRPRACSHLLI